MSARWLAMALLGACAWKVRAEENTTAIFDAVETNLSADLVVGDAGTNNTAHLLGGAVVSCEESAIGTGPGADGNRVSVSGAGTEWRTRRLLAAGVRGSANELAVSNGAAVLADQCVVGQFAGAASNRLGVAGPGAACVVDKDLTVGWSGSGNEVLVVDGGLLLADRSAVGLGPDAVGNRVEISGAGSTWTNAGALAVGWEGAGSDVRIADGGRLHSTFGQVGLVWTASGGVVAVESGAAWALSTGLTVGVDAPGNLLAISNGSVACSDAVIGDFSRALDNEVRVLGTSSLWEVRGPLTIGADGAGSRVRLAAGGRLVTAAAGLGLYEGSAGSEAQVEGGAWSNAGPLLVGILGPACAVRVAEGGTLTVASSVYVGVEPSAAGAVLDASGQGASVRVAETLVVGERAPSSEFTAGAGALVACLSAVIGNELSASNCSAVAWGPGTVWSNAADLTVGIESGGNILQVLSGARLETLYASIGFATSSVGNAIAVAGPGSVWRSSGSLTVGAEGRSNALLVAGGGRVECLADLLIGEKAAGAGNGVLVSGGGSLLSVRYALLVGAEGSASSLVATNLGAIRCSDLAVGSGAASGGNVVGLHGGALSVTNYGSAVLAVERGLLDLRSGSLKADALEIGEAGEVYVEGGFSLAGAGPVSVRGVFRAGGSIAFLDDVSVEGNGLLACVSNGVTWTFGGSFRNWSSNPAMDLLGARLAFPGPAARALEVQDPDAAATLAGFGGRRGIGALVVDGVVSVAGIVYVWSLEGEGELAIGPGSKVYYVTDEAWSGSVTVEGDGVFERIPVELKGIVPAGAGMELTWPGAAGLNFAVEWGTSPEAADFATATNLAAPGMDARWMDAGSTNRPPPAESGVRTYRIKAFP